VEAKLAGQNVALTRFWGAVTRPAVDSETHQRIAGFGVSDKAFFEQLAHVTGGTFQFVSDGGRLPPPFGGFVGVQTIPALDGWGLSLLAAALLASAVALLRRRRL
jgi:long-subunit acyl-CoA synthetase (AMP-forming)